MTERRTGRLPQAFARAVATELSARMDEAGLTGQRLATLLSRSAGYVSERRNGKAAWTTDDIDVISAELGLDPLLLLVEISASLERDAGKAQRVAEQARGAIEEYALRDIAVRDATAIKLRRASGLEPGTRSPRGRQKSGE